MAESGSGYLRRFLLVGLAAALMFVLVPAVNANTRGHQARAADAFVDSIGVNIHLHYTDTVYNDFETIRSQLKRLGVRHVRDAVYTNGSVGPDYFYYERLRKLAESGIGFSLITSLDSRHSSRTNLALLDDIYRWTKGGVVSYEGVNEPDLFVGGNWVAETVDLQKQLWSTVRGDSELNGVDVVGPSPAFEPGALPDLSAYIDYGNWHGYPGGLCVGCKNGANKTILDYLPAHRKWSGSAPIMVTETGYHTGVNVPGSETHNPASETAQAKYVPRLLLEYFNAGIERSFLYELMDVFDDPSRSEREHNFGLVRNNGAPKPAYLALQNLIAILKDPGPRFKPGSLDYSLSGDTGGVHSTLLQKRNGTFYLALWREVPSWDTGSRKDIDVSSQKVTLRLGSAAGVDTYRPNVSRNALESWGARKEVALGVDDEVLIVAIRDPKTPAPELDASPRELGTYTGMFRDDDNSPHEKNIDKIAKAGITRGCNPPANTEFCPRDEVKRGPMAAFLSRALNLPPTNEDHFLDDQLSIFEADINRLAGSAVTLGCDPPVGQQYCPDDTVKRGQMAALMVRAWGLPPTKIDYFVDDDGSLFENAINRLAAAGITKGCNPPSNNKFCPNQPVTREQMASFLVRAKGW